MLKSCSHPKAHSRTTRPSGFVLGRDHFARISAVEGIVLTDEMRAMIERFDRDGLSAEDRRRAILQRFTPRGRNRVDGPVTTATAPCARRVLPG